MALRRRLIAQRAQPEFNADGALEDLIGSILQTCHEESERHLPLEEEILQGLKCDEREKILTWLVQVCILRNISDSVLYTTVLIFDRYCAASRHPLPLDRLHLTVLAILSLAIKVTGGTDDTRNPSKLRELLSSLGHQQFSVEQIFASELEVLTALNFEVSAPNSFDFLEALALPFTQPEHPKASSPVVCLAKFLLQLSLMDVHVHYRYPHAILAAGALYVALWCAQANQDTVANLLCDVTATLGGLEHTARDLVSSQEVGENAPLLPEKTTDLGVNSPHSQRSPRSHPRQSSPVGKGRHSPRPSCVRDGQHRSLAALRRL